MMWPACCCLPVVLCALFALACGGGATGAEAKAPASASNDEDGPREPSESTDNERETEGSPAVEAIKRPSCDDGTCSPCGSGICPTGWYCDEGATGGAACSWLKECADKPSCGCVTRVLGSSCQCREEAGGLKVSCR